MSVDLNLLKKITFVDFATNYSTGGFLYPPCFIWHSVKDHKKLEIDIKNSIKKSSDDFAMYVHFPFCISKCSFCRFYSLSKKNLSEYDKFLNLMIKELEIWAKLIHSSRNIKGRIPLESIYCGGGTPSLFNLERFFKELRKYFDIKNSKQINVESSLDSLNKEKLLSYKKIGVNRLLIGVQSLDKKVLKTMDRPFSKSESFEEIYKLAKKIGIPNINIELIAGLPNQIAESFLDDISRLIKLKVDSIHRYRFISTPLSILGKRKYRHSDIFRSEILRVLKEAGRKLINAGYTPIGDEWVLSDKSKVRNIQTNFSRPNMIIIGPSSNGSFKTNNYNLYFSNTFDINKYKNKILKGDLSIEKYFILKGEEELTRTRLINTMRHPYFKKSPDLKKFNEELEFLESKNIIKIKDEKIKNHLNRINNLDYSIYPKVFYSPKILKECEKIINKKYSNSNFDLSFLSL